jgi:ParB-like chromosome segregation protein Spo0J
MDITKMPKVEMRKLDDLREYENNARKITKKAVDYVAQSIKESGFISPLVVTLDGEIVCGHVSARGARQAGLTEVPCVIIEDLTEEQIKAYRLADNKTAAMAIWDTDKLKEELGKLVSEQFSMEGMGFDAEMLGEVASLPETDVEVKNTSSEFDLEGDFGDEAFKHECPHCGLKF